MNGQLSDRPLAELIREISAKSQSGRLRLERERAKVAAYFDNGKFVYAACNVRTFRLREYLQKTGLLSADQLAAFQEGVSDFELARQMCAGKLLTPETVEQIQTRQVSDILRLALLWSDGVWEFDPRSHLDETVNLNVDMAALLVEAERRMKPAEEPQPTETDAGQVDSFLERLRHAESHYDVLGVDTTAPAADLKSAYYDLARRYHPDRFRRVEPALLSQLESAFAKITQAYDTLRDDGLRANYNARLQARNRAQQAAGPTRKPASPAPEPTPAKPEATPEEPRISAAERAANDFKEGYAALEQGQRSAAAGLFASAARLAPNEARYRAFYGQVLAEQENTRRAAEAELQAAVKLDPGNAEYRVMLAQLFRDLGFSIRAKGEAERAIAADPNNRRARELLRELKGD